MDRKRGQTHYSNGSTAEMGRPKCALGNGHGPNEGVGPTTEHAQRETKAVTFSSETQFANASYEEETKEANVHSVNVEIQDEESSEGAMKGSRVRLVAGYQDPKSDTNREEEEEEKNLSARDNVTWEPHQSRMTTSELESTDEGGDTAPIGKSCANSNAEGRGRNCPDKNGAGRNFVESEQMANPDLEAQSNEAGGHRRVSITVGRDEISVIVPDNIESQPPQSDKELAYSTVILPENKSEPQQFQNENQMIPALHTDGSSTCTPITSIQNDENLVYIPVTTVRPPQFKGPLREQHSLTKTPLKLVIGITAYNEDGNELKETLRAVAHNLDHLCETYDMHPKEVLVILIFDGRERMSESMQQYLINSLGVYEKSVLLSEYCGTPVTCHLFEKSVKLPQYSSHASYFEPLSLLVAIKEKNGGKLNSHLWLFQAFCRCLNPRYCCLLDIGTCPKENAIGLLYKSLEENPQLGGCAGEIRVRNPKLLNILESSQNFEYKVAHLLDKTMESVFGYISVLPGAFSIFRWRAIQGTPLIRYFRLEEHSINSIGPFLANMFLAEDRVLALEVVAKQHCHYTLTFVEGAVATTDVPGRMLELVKQRRRWINGAFFSLAYYLLKFPKMVKDTNHSLMRRFGFFIQFFYYNVILVLNWFNVAFLYLSFQIIFRNALEDITGRDVIMLLFNVAYGGALFLQLLLALLVKVEEVERTYLFISLVFGVCAFIALTLGVWYIASGGILTVFFIAALAGLGSYFTGALLHRQLLTVLSTFFQYIFTMPTYINVFTLYSFANLNDISWGTKEGNLSTQVAIEPLRAKLNKGKTSKIFDSLDYADADLVALEGTIKQHVKRLKAAANVPDSDGSGIKNLTPEKLWISALEEAQEDRLRAEVARKREKIEKEQDEAKKYFGSFRTNMLILWTLTNIAIAFTSFIKLIGVIWYYGERPFQIFYYKLCCCKHRTMEDTLETEDGVDLEIAKDIPDITTVAEKRLQQESENHSSSAAAAPKEDADMIHDNSYDYNLPRWVTKGRKRVKLLKEGELLQAEIVRGIYQKTVARKGHDVAKILDYVPHVRSLADVLPVPLRAKRLELSQKLVCYVELDLLTSSSEECQRTILSVLENCAFIIRKGIPPDQLSVVFSLPDRHLVDEDLSNFLCDTLKLMDPELLLSTHRGMNVECHVFERSIHVNDDHAVTCSLVLPDSFQGADGRFEFFRENFPRQLNPEYIGIVVSSSYPKVEALYKLLQRMENRSGYDACVGRSASIDLELVNVVQSSEDFWTALNESLVLPGSSLVKNTEIVLTPFCIIRWASIRYMSANSSSVAKSDHLPSIFESAISLKLNAVLRTLIYEGQRSNGKVIYEPKAIYNKAEKPSISRFVNAHTRSWQSSYFASLQHIKDIMTFLPKLDASFLRKVRLSFAIFWQIPRAIGYSLGPSLLYAFLYYTLNRVISGVESSSWILFVWHFIYMGVMVAQLLIATSAAVDRMNLAILLCVMMHSLFFVALAFLGLTVSLEDFSLDWILLAGIVGIFCASLICSILWANAWRFVSRVLQFLLLVPVYVNIVPVYSMCRDTSISSSMSRATLYRRNTIASNDVGEGVDVETFPKTKKSSEYIANAKHKIRLLQRCRQGDKSSCERLEREETLKSRVQETAHFFSNVAKLVGLENRTESFNHDEYSLRTRQLHQTAVSIFQVKTVFLWIGTNLVISYLVVYLELEQYGALAAVGVPLLYVIPLSVLSIFRKIWAVWMAIVRMTCRRDMYLPVRALASSGDKLEKTAQILVDDGGHIANTEAEDLIEGAIFMEDNVTQQLSVLRSTRRNSQLFTPGRSVRKNSQMLTTPAASTTGRKSHVFTPARRNSQLFSPTETGRRLSALANVAQ